MSEQLHAGQGAGVQFNTSRREDANCVHAQSIETTRHCSVSPLSGSGFRTTQDAHTQNALTQSHPKSSERRSRFTECFSDIPRTQHRTYDDASPVRGSERGSTIMHTLTSAFEQVRDASPHERARREAAEYYQACRVMAYQQRILRGEANRSAEGSRNRSLSGLQRQGAVRRRPTGTWRFSQDH